MKLQLKVLSLTANLPLSRSDILVVLQDKLQANSAQSCSLFELNDECVLSTEPAEVDLSENSFTVQVQNPEDHKNINLLVLAKSFQRPRPILLGSVQIDIGKLKEQQFQTSNRNITKKPLFGTLNQKGSISLQIVTLETLLESNHRNLKSAQQLDKDQTCSSDSYEANLKQLCKSISSEDTFDFSPKFKQSLELHLPKHDYSQKIILEEIDLEDDEESQLDETSFLPKQMTPKIRIKNKQNDIKKLLLVEKFKIQSHLHILHETDFFLLRMEQKMRAFQE